jgi:signal transduction histidine kinase
MVPVMGALTVPEYRWLLPATLTAAGDPDTDAGPVRRSTRDWIVDTLCFLLGAGWAVIGTADLTEPEPTILAGYVDSPPWLLALDLIVGVLVATALWWRRRWPIGVLVASSPAMLFSATSAISLLIMVFTVAVHRRFVVAGTVTLVNVGTFAVANKLRPDTTMPYWEAMAWTAVFGVLVLLWGMVVRARRQLVVSLRDRAERAESEQQLRVAQAQALERTRIAREMHDVLAHRISLLTLHAGALEIRPDAEPAEVARAAGVIRDSAHAALQDLRQVIGVLRDTSAGGAPERPQPTLGELSTLVDESRSAGVRVSLNLRVDPAMVPDAVGRTAYRIVQEGLTNARKHAAGTAVTVTVDGTAGGGLAVDVRNPCPVGDRHTPALPGTGTGLVGLAERATLAGGRLAHGRTEGGDFALTAWLPWPE